MALVIDPNIYSKPKAYYVQNLGWILRHWKSISNVKVVEALDGISDALMIVYLTNGTVYITHWASRSVMWNWMCRPTWRGTQLNWFGITTTCGGIKPNK